MQIESSEVTIARTNIELENLVEESLNHQYSFSQLQQEKKTIDQFLIDLQGQNCKL